jgi:biopolymer transport protein ExbB
MKKALSMLFISAMLVIGGVNLYAQDAAATPDTNAPAQTEAPAATAAQPATTEASAEEETEATAEKPFTQVLTQKFIEGDPLWMSPVLFTLILGLAIVIERLLYLSFSMSNEKKLLSQIEEALNNGGVEAAKEVCRSTRGPVASIFYEGLDHYDEGMEMVDKSLISTGSVENGKLEKGVSWIALFIALAPMLGFLGTVIGMVQAFDAIEAAGDISPTLVAAGIKVALLTTVFGLIVAIILQVFYNLIVAMIDGIVIKMEDSSISFLDLLVAYNKKNAK